MRIAEALKVPLPSLFDFMHHDPESISSDALTKKLEDVDEQDRQLLYRITEWMREMRGV